MQVGVGVFKRSTYPYIKEEKQNRGRDKSDKKFLIPLSFFLLSFYHSGTSCSASSLLKESPRLFFVKDGFGGDGTGYPSKLGALGDDRLRSRAREIDNKK